jgi:hypothetical protein
LLIYNVNLTFWADLGKILRKLVVKWKKLKDKK